MRQVVHGAIPPMSRDEWYRRSTWTTEDEQEFRARLKRARSFSRPQYLRLQAIHLEQAGLLDEAIQLLEEVVREYAEDGQIAWVHDHLGSCHEKAGRIDEAIQELRLSIAAQERPVCDEQGVARARSDRG